MALISRGSVSPFTLLHNIILFCWATHPHIYTQRLKATVPLSDHCVGVISFHRLNPVFVAGGGAIDLFDEEQRALHSKILAIMGDPGISKSHMCWGDCGQESQWLPWAFIMSGLLNVALTLAPLRRQISKGKEGGGLWCGDWKDTQNTDWICQRKTDEKIIKIAGTLFIAVTAVVVHPFPFMDSDLGDAT